MASMQPMAGRLRVSLILCWISILSNDGPHADADNQRSTVDFVAGLGSGSEIVQTADLYFM